MITVNRRIWLGFSLMLVLLVVMATVGFRALQRATAGNYEAVIARSNLRDDPAVPDAHGVDDFAEREVVGFAIFAFAVGIVSASTLSRSINKMLGETTTVLASSAAEILASTTEQAASGSESMAAVAQTAATVDQVAQASDQANQRARTMSEAAQRAAEIGKVGRKAVDDSVAAMGQVRTHVDSIASQDHVVLSKSRHRLHRRRDCLRGRDRGADEPSSAQRGYRGGARGRRGEWVPRRRREIRRLAEQSKKATVQVRQILGDIQRATSSAVLVSEQGTQQVQAGVKQVSEAGETIRSLTDVVTQSAQVSAQILASSSQQAAGMSQIRQAMANIQEATQQNVTASQQNERAARDLAELGNKLLALIGVSQRPTQLGDAAAGMNKEALAARLLVAFLEDLDEQLRTLNADLLVLETNPGDAERLKRVFRAAHTLKGAARATGIPYVEPACHALEDLLADATRWPANARCPSVRDTVLRRRRPRRCWHAPEARSVAGRCANHSARSSCPRHRGRSCSPVAAASPPCCRNASPPLRRMSPRVTVESASSPIRSIWS